MPSLLQRRSADTIMTNHTGELARLLGVSTPEIVAGRLGFAERAATETASVVLLKGHGSLVTSPAGDIFFNPTGNPMMASGGSGDVLTGLLGALLAQGVEPLTATQLAAYLHGLAGDLAAQTAGAAIAAGDLVSHLPRAFRELRAS
jgi:NAD(P)H-hydrate epimerase